MTSLQVHQQLNDILEAFQISIKHPYLQKFLQDPLVDEDQVTLLIYMLNEKEFDRDYINKCIVSTILVQAALDTHDKVCDDELTNELANKKRQLTVLAGDYYSSLYYYILSKLNDIALIQVLAKSIQEINESKMNVYKNRVKYVRASSKDVKTIDSSLLQNIALLHKLPEWKEISEEFFYFKRLLKERSLLLKTGVKGALTQLILQEENQFDRHDLPEYLEKHISFSKDRIFQLSIKWDGFKAFIQARVNEMLQEHCFDKQRVMGER